MVVVGLNGSKMTDYIQILKITKNMVVIGLNGSKMTAYTQDSDAYSDAVDLLGTLN